MPRQETHVYNGETDWWVMNYPPMKAGDTYTVIVYSPEEIAQQEAERRENEERRTRIIPEETRKTKHGWQFTPAHQGWSDPASLLVDSEDDGLNFTVEDVDYGVVTHLKRDQVEKLWFLLHHWLDYGDMGGEEEE